MGMGVVVLGVTGFVVILKVLGQGEEEEEVDRCRGGKRKKVDRTAGVPITCICR